MTLIDLSAPRHMLMRVLAQASPHDFGPADTVVLKPFLDELVAAGLLTIDGTTYQIADAGRAALTEVKP